MFVSCNLRLTASAAKLVDMLAEVGVRFNEEFSYEERRGVFLSRRFPDSLDTVNLEKTIACIDEVYLTSKFVSNPVGVVIGNEKPVYT